jgi:hypothetical protein
LDLKRKKWWESGEDCIMRSFTRRVRHIACMGEMRNAYNILVGKPEGKRPLGRPRHRWEGNVRMDLREIQWEGVDEMHLAQDSNQWQALVNMIMNLQVPLKVLNFLMS